MPDVKIAGVIVSNSARILFPDVGITKLMLAQYYEEIAPWILPHLAQRPLTLVRCPQGVGESCFYQRHASDSTGKDIKRIDAHHSMIANTTQALISLVQMSTLELHTWGSHAPQLEKPDRIIFDLDPAEDL